jgi:glucose/arabinose dehydrogenase
MASADWDAIHMLNPSSSPASVSIYIGGTLRTSLDLPVGAADYRAFNGLIGGPVRVTSTQPILVTQRIIGWGGWKEVFGVPTALAANEWHFTWYDMQGAQWDAIHVINPSSTTATVSIHVGGLLQSTLTLGSGKATYAAYAGLIDGPVRVVSNVPVMSSQRILGWESFEETIGASLEPAPPPPSPQVLFTGLDYPVALAFTPDGRLFFDEKNTGKVRVIENGVVQATAFATLPASNSGEQGLLGIALDPNFASNKFVYVYYTYSDGLFYHARITRFTAVGNVGTNAVQIFDVIDPTPESTNHNGGYIKFGPDGRLYVQIGEFAVPSLSQNLSSDAGKILRMNPDGSVPADNPFSGSLVYAYGIRNGFGMDFDPFGGKLIATEAGPDRNDEINIIVTGANYGWPTYTGVSNDPAYEDPILIFNPPTTPTGIAYSAAQNTLYFGEFNTGALKKLLLTPSGAVAGVQLIATVGSTYNGILAVESGPDGSIYFSTSNTIYVLGNMPSQSLASALTIGSSDRPGGKISALFLPVGFSPDSATLWDSRIVREVRPASFIARAVEIPAQEHRWEQSSKGGP